MLVPIHIIDVGNFFYDAGNLKAKFLVWNSEKS